jgi:cell division protein FtsB
MIFSPEGLPRLRGLERELGQVQEETAELGREIEALRGRVQRLRDDPTAVERIARDKATDREKGCNERGDDATATHTQRPY